MARPPKWTREEMVILVKEYFESRDKSSQDQNAAAEKVSVFLRKRQFLLTKRAPDEKYRNYAGIKMQMAALKGFDPDTRDIGTHGSRLQLDIMNEYLKSPEKIIEEAREIYLKYGGEP